MKKYYYLVVVGIHDIPFLPYRTLEIALPDKIKNLDGFCKLSKKIHDEYIAEPFHLISFQLLRVTRVVKKGN